MPAQPALTNGATARQGHPILKWSLIALAVVWSIAILRLGFFDKTQSSEHTTRATHPVGSTVPATGSATAANTGAVVTELDATAPSDADTQILDQVIESFVTTWLVPGTPNQRQIALAPLATPDLVAQFALTPPDALPQAQLVGIPQIASMDATTAIATATLSDGTAFALQLQRPDANSTWLVAALDKPAGPTATPSAG